MTKLNFYYDESNHDRRLSTKTLNDPNFGKEFTTAIIGFSDEDKAILESKFYELKALRKNKSDLDQELKGNKTFKTKSLEYGFHSLTKNNITFVNDFIDLFTENIYVYIGSFNKMETIIHRILPSDIFTPGSDRNHLRYSIAKYLEDYFPKSLINELEKPSRRFVIHLKNSIESKLNELEALFKSNPEKYGHKISQIEAYTNIVDNLKSEVSTRTIETHWDHTQPFYGFNKFLSDLNISDYSLTLDKGSNSKTVAKKAGLKNVDEDDSENSIGIQIADLLVALISKLESALNNDLQLKIASNDHTFNNINLKWFDLNQDQFNLYVKLNDILSKFNFSQFKLSTSMNSSSLTYLYVLINTIGNYKSFENYKSINKNKDVRLNLLRNEFNNRYQDAIMDYFNAISTYGSIYTTTVKIQRFALTTRPSYTLHDIQTNQCVKIMNEDGKDVTSSLIRSYNLPQSITELTIEGNPLTSHIVDTIEILNYPAFKIKPYLK